jgi:hypothetical protein
MTDLTKRAAKAPSLMGLRVRPLIAAPSRREVEHAGVDETRRRGATSKELRGRRTRCFR